MEVHMLGTITLGGSPRGLRPATAADAPFLEQLYRSTRPDLQQLDATPGQGTAVVAQQYAVLQSGIGASFPDALQFAVEQAPDLTGTRGVDSGPNYVRLTYLPLGPAA